MRLAKIKIRGLRSIVAYERDLTDEWFGEISPAILAVGLNGAGKTTLLETIAWLWGDFGQLLRSRTNPRHVREGMFSECRIAAIQLHGLLPGDDPPTWLFVANRKEFDEFEQDLAGCQYWGMVRESASKWRFVTHDPAWRTDLAEKREQSLVGSLNLPNIVYITSDDRSLIEPRTTGKVKPLDPEMNWLAVYRSADTDVSDLMYRMKAEDPEKFKAVLGDMNSFLSAKRIDGFFDDGKLRVRTDSGGVHSVYRLSTGERQFVLLTAFISRWLRPGGILLVDEPDLHLHVSATLAMVDALQSLAEDRGAQAIFTSHNPEVWQDFERPAQRIELQIGSDTPGAGAGVGEAVSVEGGEA